MDEKVAMVTGAASGIGAALTRLLLSRGAHVVAADVDAAGLDRLEGAGDRLDRVVLDVRRPDEVFAVVRDVTTRHGRLDLMVNNAGVVVGGPFEATSDEAWSRVVDVNLWGVVHGTRAAYDAMRAQRHGHIVNVASSAGVMPVAHSVAYAATKHAVVGLSTSLRAEARGAGVNVSVVVPGVVDTAIFSSATNVGGYDYERAMRRVPFRKVTASRAAEHILAGVEHNRAVITFPAYNRALVALHRLMPEAMSAVVNREHHVTSSQEAAL